jgi:hypothetical protein
MALFVQTSPQFSREQIGPAATGASGAGSNTTTKFTVHFTSEPRESNYGDTLLNFQAGSCDRRRQGDHGRPMRAFGLHQLSALSCHAALSRDLSCLTSTGAAGCTTWIDVSCGEAPTQHGLWSFSGSDPVGFTSLASCRISGVPDRGDPMHVRLRSTRPVVADSGLARRDLPA